jgi:hypothetical protein
LTLAQLQQRREYQQQQFSLIRLRLSAAGSKLRLAVEPFNDLKRVTIALATGKISRIPALAKILLRPSTVAAMFERAVDGVVPHGEFDKEEVEKTVALLILGGHAAVCLGWASQGGPTAKTARRSDLFKSPRFFVCSGPVTVHTLCHNLGSFLSITPPPNEQCAWHLSMDNVNIEERLRYSHEGGPLLGGLKGVARESSYTGSLKIVSYADFLVIKEALKQGQISLGKEITMIVAIRNSRDSLVVPLFASCTAARYSSSAAKEGPHNVLTSSLLGGCLISSWCSRVSSYS